MNVSVQPPPLSSSAAASVAAPPAKTGLAAVLTPQRMVSSLVTLILVIGQLGFNILPSLWVLPITLGTAMLLEAGLSRVLRGVWPSVLSAYIAGNSVVILVKPQSGLWWPFGAAIAITSKYVLTYRGRHLWNPTNFAITAMVLIAPHSISILSHEWGNEVWPVAVIWGVGLLVVRRAKLLHITLTYLASFVVLAILRAALMGRDWMTEVTPVTGTMYQFLMFFMLTDPRTTVSTTKGRVLVTILIALAECGLRLANDFGYAWAQPVATIPAMASLFVIGPIAMLIDLQSKPARTS
jgi:Na+-transporting NADH:ubiquinone oxidoreductase subunit NqrB